MDLRAATVQLSLLADALIRAALKLVAQSSEEETGLIVFGLGKLGGEELNYSSDIDLIFLAAEQPQRYIPVAQRLIRALQSATGEGFLYRVDMRLRPWGRAGALVTSAASFMEYLLKDAELWERQALLKARLVVGNPLLGRQILEASQHLIFSDDPQAVRESVRTAKQRIEAALDKRGQQWGEVKSGTGSIRDIEFLTQYLQLIHGARHPELRTPNTLEGLIRLTDAGLLQADEYRYLTSGYVFLRTIEHALQLMHNKQVHRLPTDARELNYLARRLDFPQGEAFVAHYERHCRATRRIYDRHLGEAAPPPVTLPLSNLPELPQFQPEEQARHRQWLAEIHHDQPVRVHTELLPGPVWRVTVVGLDQPGDLSIICGLLYVYGFDILDGLVTTGWYPETWKGLQPTGERGRRHRDTVRDFVDVFTVRPPHGAAEPDVWIRYEADLTELFRLLRDGHDGEAQGRLANRVASALEDPTTAPVRLSPVDVQIDNEADPVATVLQIRADDTLGFLYELANALSLSSIDIQLVVIRSDGRRVFDTLHVTDARHGGKITDPSRLQQMQAAVVLIKHFTHLLPNAPHPEAALQHFRSFVQALFQQPNWWEEWSALERPEVLDALARLLGVSDFLWEDVLRLQYANLFPLLRDQAGLHQRKTREDWQQELASLWQPTAELPPSKAKLTERTRLLNDFKDREMFRTDMRHILGHVPDFDSFAAELTDLADVVVRSAAESIFADLQAKHGTPIAEGDTSATWCLAALGKCGGQELGFASDIELLFIYSADGESNGHDPLPNATFFQRQVERLTQMIRAKREGVFHLDLRLRPYGKAGPLAVSLATFSHYYAPDGPAWPFERQALVKLRPVAGDEALGHSVLAMRDRYVFTGTPFDTAALRAMREKQVRQLVKPGTFHAKLSPGGLVDLEYLVQALQMQHGHAAAAIRTPHTHRALAALAAAGVIQPDDYHRASAAYVFFRRLIDALRMVRGDARDLTVPSSRTEEFEYLTRRLGYAGNVAQVKAEIDLHSRHILDLVRKLLPYDPLAAGSVT
jgi:[glutamine synthetase] adenylyltransferase / [glutamine synthetase]-adenylyl-L-tyrosine phosphorylase